MSFADQPLAGYLLLVLTILFGWWGFAHEFSFVHIQYSDIAFHISVLEALDRAVKEGQNPLDFWYDTVPYGFALFRTYQYLPYLFVYGFYRLAAEHFSLASVLVSCTFVLASTLLPLSVFYSLRVVGATLLQCGIAAVLSVLISDGSEFGMGLQNYTFGTYGLITQLWAMVFLPAALAASLRYLTQGKSLGAALLFSFLTFGSHVIGAAILGICLMVFTIGRILETRRMDRRPWIFFVLFLLVTAHQWVFILVDAPHIHRSALEPSWKYEGRGIAYLAELFWNGELFDKGRFPVLTLLVLLSFPYACIFLKKVRAASGGSFVAYSPILFILFFSLCVGRQIWGWLFSLLPVLESLHVHRFLIAAHFFAVVMISHWLSVLFELLPGYFITVSKLTWTKRRASGYALCAGIVVAVTPAILERAEMFRANFARQRDTAALIEKDLGLTQMLSALKNLPYGWTYVGSPSSWQKELFSAGYMQLDIMTTMQGTPTVGGILYHGFSLAGETLFDFNPSSRAHFDLFGIRNIVSPAGWPGVSGFSLVGKYDRYALWTRDSHMLFVADRSFEFGSGFSKQSAPSQTASVRDFVQRYQVAAAGTQVTGSVGNVMAQEMNSAWHFEGTAQMQTPGMVVAAEAFHPNWLASVDGEQVQARRVQPGLMALDVPQGSHRISFTYQGSHSKLLLLIMACGVILCSFYVRVRV